MRTSIIISIISIALFASCEYDSLEQEPVPVDQNFQLKVNTSFEGAPIEIYEYYTNVEGDLMNFEQIKMYIADIRLIKEDGSEVVVSPIEYFNFEGTALTRSYSVANGNYTGIIYHVGVPTSMNGTDDPSFLINQYGSGNPLNVQNGMYWNWNNGYRFLIYEGRLDTTPTIPGDVPAFFSIHMGKDTLYTTIQVDMPMSINSTETRVFNLDWDLSKTIYTSTDTLNLRSPLESQFHGEDLNLGFRFQACFENALSHSVE